MAHFTRRRHEAARAGCLFCKPHEVNGSPPDAWFPVSELRRPDSSSPADQAAGRRLGIPCGWLIARLPAKNPSRTLGSLTRTFAVERPSSASGMIHICHETYCIGT